MFLISVFLGLLGHHIPISTTSPIISASTQHVDENGIVFSRCVQNGTIALTFDDGPNPGRTEPILQLLKERNISATFFVVGVNLVDPLGREILLATHRAGHSIGHHTWSHQNLTAVTYKEILQEMYLLTNQFVEIIKESPNVLRPPYGEYDDEVLRVVNGELGYKVIMWSIDTNDWRHPGDTAAGLEEYVKAFNGTDPAVTPGFVSLHHEKEVGSLELANATIDYALSIGYRYVSLNECLGL